MESDDRDPAGITIERYGEIAGALSVFGADGREEILRSVELDERLWAEVHTTWSRRMQFEVRHAMAPGRTGPMPDRLPLSTRYAMAYSEAVKRFRDEQEGRSPAQPEEAESTESAKSARGVEDVEATVVGVRFQHSALAASNSAAESAREKDDEDRRSPSASPSPSKGGR